MDASGLWMAMKPRGAKCVWLHYFAHVEDSLVMSHMYYARRSWARVPDAAGAPSVQV